MELVLFRRGFPTDYWWVWAAVGFIIASTIINVLAFVTGATFLPGGRGASPLLLVGGVVVLSCCINCIVGLLWLHAMFCANSCHHVGRRGLLKAVCCVCVRLRYLF